jgi:hypothetical protein
MLVVVWMVRTCVVRMVMRLSFLHHLSQFLGLAFDVDRDPSIFDGARCQAVRAVAAAG